MVNFAIKGKAWGTLPQGLRVFFFQAPAPPPPLVVALLAAICNGDPL